MATKIEMLDGSEAEVRKLEGETVYWQGTGIYTIVHNQAFWGYVKITEEWLVAEPEVEYRIVEEEFLDKE